MAAEKPVELPKELQDMLYEAFITLDRNHSDSIETKEIGFLMNKLLGKNLDEDALYEILTEIADSDAPGAVINFEHFKNAVGPLLLGSSEDDLDAMAFNAMDADGSGCISATELQPLMSAVAGQKLDTNQVKQVLKFSSGDDGKLRFEDFKRAVRTPSGKPAGASSSGASASASGAASSAAAAPPAAPAAPAAPTPSDPPA